MAGDVTMIKATVGAVDLSVDVVPHRIHRWGVDLVYARLDLGMIDRLLGLD